MELERVSGTFCCATAGLLGVGSESLKSENDPFGVTTEESIRWCDRNKVGFRGAREIRVGAPASRCSRESSCRVGVFGGGGMGD